MLRKGFKTVIQLFSRAVQATVKSDRVGGMILSFIYIYAQGVHGAIEAYANLSLILSPDLVIRDLFCSKV
jgi:hypothetical protein